MLWNSHLFLSSNYYYPQTTLNNKKAFCDHARGSYLSRLRQFRVVVCARDWLQVPASLSNFSITDTLIAWYFINCTKRTMLKWRIFRNVYPNWLNWSTIHLGTRVQKDNSLALWCVRLKESQTYSMCRQMHSEMGWFNAREWSHTHSHTNTHTHSCTH